MRATEFPLWVQTPKRRPVGVMSGLPRSAVIPDVRRLVSKVPTSEVSFGQD
jgi:hypothetical protein